MNLPALPTPVVRCNERTVWVGDYIATLVNFPPSATWNLTLIKDTSQGLRGMPAATWEKVDHRSPTGMAIAAHLEAHGLL